MAGNKSVAAVFRRYNRSLRVFLVCRLKNNETDIEMDATYLPPKALAHNFKVI